jgi:hypothetical protein
MLMSRHQDARQDHNIKLANRSFENVAKIKYLEMRVKSQNWNHGEIKCIIYSGSSCYSSLQNPVSSYLSSKKIKTCKK